MTLSPTVAYNSEPVSTPIGSEIGMSGRLLCGALLALKNKYFIKTKLLKVFYTNRFDSNSSVIVVVVFGSIGTSSTTLIIFSSGLFSFTFPSNPSNSFLF